MPSEGIQSLRLLGHPIHLLPQKALFLEQLQALILADPHFGKTAHFRKSGIPIPGGPDGSNYKTLEGLMENWQAKTVYILGDLFHSQMNKEWQAFAHCIRQHPQVDFHLIQGNHDILPAATYAEAGLQLHTNPLNLGPFLLSHKPLDKQINEAYNLAGHLHPGIQLQGKGRQGLKLPCFHLKENQMILPAFGHFTGTRAISPGPADRIFAIAEEAVVEFSTNQKL